MKMRPSLPAIVVEDWTAKGRTGGARLGALAGALGLLLSSASGCGSRTSEPLGGETHWLSACDTQEGCGDGLDCICGRCTTSCSSDAVCRDLAPRAACLPTQEVADAKRCHSAPLRICGEVAEATAADASGEASRDAEVPPAATSGEMDASRSSMNVSEVTAPMTDGSSEGAPSASTQVGIDSEPPSTIDELPTPEGWDGLKLIDPYSDECVIYDKVDRNSEPYGEEGSCTLGFSCADGGGATAICTLQDDGVYEGRWDCACIGSGRTDRSTFVFEDVGLTEIQACRLAGALCATEVPPEMAMAQESCGPTSSTIYMNSCEHQADCVRAVTAGDVVLDQTLQNQASCSWYEGDLAWCSCTGVLSSVTRFSVSPAMTDESCDVATSLCNEGVEAGSLGAIECTLDPQLSSADELWCDEIYQCAQSAVVQGRNVEFGAQVRDHCYHYTPSDPWECSCGGGANPASISAPDATTACQLNLQRCLEFGSDDLREW